MFFVYLCRKRRFHTFQKALETLEIENEIGNIHLHDTDVIFPVDSSYRTCYPPCVL